MNYVFFILGITLSLISIDGLSSSPVFGQSQSEVNIEPGAGVIGTSCVTTANCFSPNPLNVRLGTTVTWKNNDSTGHTVTSVDSRCNGPHVTIEIETDNRKVDPMVMIRTSFTEITYAKLAEYQPYAEDNKIAPIRKLVYEAYVSPASKSFEVVVVEGIGKNTFSVHKSVNVEGCDVGASFQSSVIQSKNTFDFTFSEAGSYNYFCTIHPWMIGQVIVDSNPSDATQPTTVEMSNITSTSIIPEFPLTASSIMIIGFSVLIFFRLGPIMKKIS